ncbi:sensor histidine kinase [Alsobacter sp. SYSU BS001988]
MNERPPSAAIPSETRQDELLRLVAESAVDFAIFTVDQTGVVTSWNIGAARMTGYDAAEIIGRNGDVLFTPEDRAAGAPEKEREGARTHGRAEDERWHVRKDGSRFWGSGLVTPLSDGSGFAKIMRDRTEQHASGQSLRESEARFRVLATRIPQLVFRCRSDGHRTWGSPQWEVYAGMSDAQSRGFDWLKAVHPDDRDLTRAAWREAQETGEYSVEHRILRVADHEYRWHRTRANPTTDGPLDTAEWVGTSTDINNLRLLQERQAVLLAELQHRTRNLLAVVQSIARKTLAKGGDLAQFAEEFEGRLRALSRVQSLTESAGHDRISLRQLIEAELDAHAPDPERVSVAGPPITLPASSAQTVALAVHELATNALKHGALGDQGGLLTVDWSLVPPDDPKRLQLDWRETRVKMHRKTGRKGYGSELIEKALPYQLQAKTSLTFGPDGVSCRIELPLGKDMDR